jgi:hypothetical protein
MFEMTSTSTCRKTVKVALIHFVGTNVYARTSRSCIAGKINYADGTAGGARIYTGRGGLWLERRGVELRIGYDITCPRGFGRRLHIAVTRAAAGELFIASQARLVPEYRVC